MNIRHPIILVLLLVGISGSVMAESCAYREAIMALDQGNTIRGVALMRMASRDGDKRASRYLANNTNMFARKNNPGKTGQKSLLHVSEYRP